MEGTLHPVGDSPEEGTPGEGLGGSSHCVSNLVSLVSVADGRSSLSRQAHLAGCDQSPAAQTRVLQSPSENKGHSQTQDRGEDRHIPLLRRISRHVLVAVATVKFTGNSLLTLQKESTDERAVDDLFDSRRRAAGTGRWIH